MLEGRGCEMGVVVEGENAGFVEAGGVLWDERLKLRLKLRLRLGL